MLNTDGVDGMIVKGRRRLPKRTDIQKVLIIGSGPIVIGQACEFDYSGTQACKALKEEGLTVILVNSNPATIMTDPEMSARTYIEPLNWEAVARIIEIERPDALLPTLGGQTGLNVAMELAERGVLEEFGVEMIGASPEAIHKAEDREAFKESMRRINLEVPKSGIAHSQEEAREVRDYVGLPAIIRPAYTLGGTGGGVAYNIEEFEEAVAWGLENSRINEVLIEESVIGWKEYELEVMRDKKDNVVIICSIENFDPMGVHTGDSITVAPAQTLTDKEYQLMRDAAIAIIRQIGVETGGSNIQFAIDPETGRMVVIEMNPRVSRSSALASKATGFPIAKFAAKLAIGYTLDEIPNDITKETPASFEPTIDYCVVKFPRWAFEKFPEADRRLTTQMKSVGEVMSIGRTFKEALQKAIRSLEIQRHGLGLDAKDEFLKGRLPDISEIRKNLIVPCAERVFSIRFALKAGMSVEEVASLSKINPWFIHNIKELVDVEDELLSYTSLDEVPAEVLREAKRLGYSDRQLAEVWNSTEFAVRNRRKSLRIEVTYKLVDTCAAEFEAYTPYYYSTYEVEDEIRVSEKPKVLIIGGGPNRIGQGIEFDYCCVHAVFALSELGYETIMVNSNPETVSTDYDTSDMLFFEPVTAEDVLNICDKLKPEGVIVQFGGQTPLNIALDLKAGGLNILGTSPENIDLAEDREKFSEVLNRLGLSQAPHGTATSFDEARQIAEDIGYPVLVRPSYVLGGRAMEIVYDRESLERYMEEAVEASPEHPVLIDEFLEGATEVDVDAVSDGERTIICGIMEHIEYAGVHSGDSACALPPFSLDPGIQEQIKEATRALASELDVCGLMNVQYATRDGKFYVLEVNPRASRTVPFVSKATGIPWARVAAKAMVGISLREQKVTEITPPHISIKEVVLPFTKFPEVDIILGPEMRSTGEVMGIDRDFGLAFAKSQMGASASLPLSGAVFISVADRDKPEALPIAKELAKLGFKILATHGTCRFLQSHGVPSEPLFKLIEGARPNTLDAIKNGQVHLIINTPTGKGGHTDEGKIRGAAVRHGIPCITTLSAARAAVRAIKALRESTYSIRALQDYHAPLLTPSSS